MARLKIVFLFETFAKNMGYLENMLPKYLARLALDIHVITTDLMPYYQFASLNSTYEEFYKDRRLTPGSVEQYDGYTLHVLPHERVLGYVRLKGLRRKLAELRPNCVYSAAAIGWIALEAGLWQPVLRYRFFTGSHTHASVFPLARSNGAKPHAEFVKNFLTRWVTGRITSLTTEKCYAISDDCADIAARFFGVQSHKIETCSLGVDTDLFSPAIEKDSAERALLRAEYGFSDQDIVCIYTGRFSDEKNPRLLAEAIERLRAQGEPFKAIFVGDGAQGESIKIMSGCTVVKFTPVEELARYYRMVEIGVWPTQESTSMLDAAACGLPIIVNDTIVATERIEGNGLTYRLNDVNDLVRALLMLKDPESRKRLGAAGAKKMRAEFSWEALARRRLTDFQPA